MRHIGCGLLLLAGAGLPSFAQSLGPPDRGQDPQAAERQQETNRRLEAIAAEIGQLREQQAEAEKREASHEAWQREGLCGATTVDRQGARRSQCDRRRNSDLDPDCSR